MTIIKKFDPQDQKKISKKYFLLAILGLFILTMTEIWVANAVASFGEKFAEISNLQQSLSLENQILENEIAQNASLNSVASQSAKLGFSKITSIQYIR